MSNEYQPSKTKQIIKRALKNPDLFTPEELQYFEYMKKLRKQQKKNKQQKSDYLK